MHPSWWGSAFEQLAAVSPARFVVVRWEGDDGTVEWANAATAALMDLEVSDIIGRRVSEVYPDRYLTEIAEQFRTAREQGSLRYEVVRELAAGRVTLNAATVPLGEDLFLSYALDVTVERETQRQLALVTELTGAGLYHWNLATDEVSWNDEMFRLFGHEPGAFVPRPGRYLEHVHPEDRSMVPEAV
ncbi:MAG: PAS domain-containing protein, partial [Nitriliruptor sp.]